MLFRSGFKGAYMGVPFEGFTLLAHSNKLQVMHISDACGPFKKTHTLFQNEKYTKEPFEGRVKDPFKEVFKSPFKKGTQKVHSKDPVEGGNLRPIEGQGLKAFERGKRVQVHSN